MSDEDQEETVTLSEADLKRQWLQRARNVMLNYYAADESVNIYGLTLTRAEADGSYWDVFEKQDDEYVYIDTLNVAQFASAAQLVRQILGYYPDESQAKEMEPEGGEEDIQPSRSFQ